MKDLRNCRCCLATYEKPTDYWCEIPLKDKKGNIKEPVGFCEFCDRNNKEYYIEDRPCHKTLDK